MEKNVDFGKKNLTAGNNAEKKSIDKDLFTSEQIEFAEKYTRDLTMNEDDFQFAKKEREDNDAAALRASLKEKMENMSEEDKKFLRQELIKEEAERLEKEEAEQIEKEANSFENYQDRERYTLFKKTGLIKNIEQYNLNRALFKDRSADKFRLFIDFYKINTSEKFKVFLGDKDNLDVLSKGRLGKIEYIFGIMNAEQFQSFLTVDRFKLFLETGNQDVLNDYLEFNKIIDPEIIQKIFKDETLDYILFSEVAPENSKYIFSSFVKNTEDIKKAFEIQQPIESLIKNANIDNLKYVVDLYQIKTLDNLEDFCSYEDAGVRGALKDSNPENFREFTKLCGNSEEFKKICNEFYVGYGLSKTKPQNFTHLIESGIINKDNLYYLRGDWIDRINSLIGTDSNEKEFAFLKRLKDQHPDNTYNTLRVLADYKNKKQDAMDIERVAKIIFEILDKVGVFTADVCEKFKNLNDEERDGYVENIKDKIGKIKEIYGFRGLNDSESSLLTDFAVGISESDFRTLCSSEMVEKIKK